MQRNATIDQLHPLFELIPDALLLADSEGLIRFVNTNLCELSGYSEEELIGSSIDMLVPSGQREVHRRHLAGFATAPSQRIMGEGRHLSLRRKSGTLVSVEISLGTAVVDGGRTKLNIASIRDVSSRDAERKNTAEQRRRLENVIAWNEAALSIAKDSAEQSQKIRAQLLSNISHELRTPLNAIRLSAHHLSDAPLFGQHRDQFKILTESVEHLSKLLHNFIDLSYLNADALNLAKRPFSLTSVISEIMTFIRPQAVEKGLLLSTDLRIQHDRLTGDGARLQQIIWNLVDNALKFSSSGDRVTVRVKQYLSADQGDVRVQISVADSGMGISKENLQKVFEPFFQVDASDTRGQGGTGTGLSVAKQIALLKGGRIRLRSRLGSGSVFSFLASFKVAAAADPAGDGASVDPKPLASAKVMIVDDSRITLKTTRRLLEKAGASVVTFEDGVGAIEALDQNPALVNAILMDIQMPQMDGITATRTLRASPRSCLIPIVGFSAGFDDSILEESISAGMNDFIQKPVDPDQLIATLSKYFQTEMHPDGVDAEDHAPWEGIAGIDSVRTEKRFRHNPAGYEAALSKFLNTFQRFMYERPIVDSQSWIRASLSSLDTLNIGAQSVGAESLAALARNAKLVLQTSDFNALSDAYTEIAAELIRIRDSFESVRRPRAGDVTPGATKLE